MVVPQGKTRKQLPPKVEWMPGRQKQGPLYASILSILCPRTFLHIKFESMCASSTTVTLILNKTHSPPARAPFSSAAPLAKRVPLQTLH